MAIDDDMMDNLDHYKYGITSTVGKLVEWLTNEFHHIISSHKEKMPTKSCRFKFPTVIWCKIPLHDVYGHYNDFKTIFNKALLSATALFREMTTLDLPTWDRNNLGYFSEGCSNGCGFSAYWKSIDSAFEQWDREQRCLKSDHKVSPPTTNQFHHYRPHRPQSFHRERQQAYDCYHWMLQAHASNYHNFNPHLQELPINFSWGLQMSSMSLTRVLGQSDNRTACQG